MITIYLYYIIYMITLIIARAKRRTSMPFGQKQAKKARISMNFTAVGHDTIDVKEEPYDFS